MANTTSPFGDFLKQKAAQENQQTPGMNSTALSSSEQPMTFGEYYSQKLAANPISYGEMTQQTTPVDEQPGFLGNTFRSLAGGALEGAGMALEGLGELGETVDDALGIEKARLSPHVVGAGKWVRDKAEGLLEGRSDATKQAIRNAEITGTLWKPSTWDFGEDPSFSGLGHQVVNTLGQIAPIIVAGVTTGGVGAAATGGFMGSQGGRDTARQQVEDAYYDGTLYDLVPKFKELIDQGMAQEKALELIQDEAEDFAQILTLPVSALGGAATSAVFKGQLGKYFGQSLGARVAGSTAGGALEEGLQEVGESFASKKGIELATELPQNYGEGTFGDFFLGAMAGGTVGAAGGAMSSGPDGIARTRDYDEFDVVPTPEPSMEAEPDVDELVEEPASPAPAPTPVEPPIPTEPIAPAAPPENAYKDPVNTPQTTQNGPSVGVDSPDANTPTFTPTEPPAQGYVRMYQGNEDTNPDGLSQFTTDYNSASNRGGDNSTVWFIDVPIGHPIFEDVDLDANDVIAELDPIDFQGAQTFVPAETDAELEQVSFEPDKAIPQPTGFSPYPKDEISEMNWIAGQDTSPTFTIKGDNQLRRFMRHYGFANPMTRPIDADTLADLQALALEQGDDIRFDPYLDERGEQLAEAKAYAMQIPGFRASEITKQSNIISLKGFKEKKDLEKFHAKFQNSVRAGALKLAELTQMAVEEGVFGPLRQGVRYVTRQGNRFEVEHVRLQKATPTAIASAKRMHERMNLGEPVFIEFNGELYIPMVRVKQLGGELDGSISDANVSALLQSGAQILAGPRRESKVNEALDTVYDYSQMDQDVYDDLYKRFQRQGFPISVDFFPDLVSYDGQAGFVTYGGVSKGLQLGLALEMPINHTFAGTYHHEMVHVMRAAGVFSGEKGKRLWKILVKNAQNYFDTMDTPYAKAHKQALENGYTKADQQEEAVARFLEAWINNQVPVTYTNRALVAEAVRYFKDFWKILASWFRDNGFTTVEDVLSFLTTAHYDDIIAVMDAPDIRGWDENAYITAFNSAGENIKRAYSKIVGKDNEHLSTLDYYGNLVKKGWTIVQLAKKNVHIKWLQEYVQYASKWQSAKTEWMVKADETASLWMKLDGQAQKNLANMLLEAEATVEYGDVSVVERNQLTQMEVDLAKKHKLTKQSLKLYARIRGDFRAMLNKIESVTKRDIERIYATNEISRELALGKIEKEFNQLKKRAYFPHARFGQFTIIVRDKKGKVVYTEMFEKESTRNHYVGEIEKQFKPEDGYVLSTSKLSEESEVYAGLPHTLLEAMKDNLELSPKQRQALEDMIVQSMPGVSFKKHFARRKSIQGFSRDALRAYADYFWHGANHIARIEYGPLMQRAIGDADANLKEMRKQRVDSTNRVRIRDHLEAHYKSIMNPKRDAAWLRSAGFFWWLGFNVKSAVLNLTQVPLVTYSYLGANFGDARAVASLSKQMATFYKLYSNPEKAQREAQKVDLELIQRGIREGFLDESFAAELAGLAEGGNLAKFKYKNQVRNATTKFFHLAGFAFQTTEKLNRRISFMAAVKLARANPNAKYLETVRKRYSIEYADLVAEGMAPSEAIAFLAGKDTVESTQFNYSAWARPQFMNEAGMANVIFTFFMFTQNMLWFTFNSPGNMRYLMMLLLFAGVQGMPGAEDMEEVVKAVAKRAFGKDYDPEKELREFLVEYFDESVPPDLILHGFSRYGFGLPMLGDVLGMPLPSIDMSANIGMGSPIPIVSPAIQAAAGLAQGRDFDESVGKFTVEGSGATLGIPFNALKAIADGEMAFDDPKRWEKAMPAAVSALSKAVRYQTEGRERTRKGATVMEFDTTNPVHQGEIIAQALGFNPTRKAQAWDRIIMQSEAVAFWNIRRGLIYDAYDRAKEGGEAADMAEFKKALTRYNRQVPYPSLRINYKKLTASYSRRVDSRRKQEQGLPNSKMMIPVYREIEELHPESRR